MIPGIVSNSWRLQLSQGMMLDSLIEEGMRRGFRAIELRQGSLGDCEIGEEHMPDAVRLGKVVDRFPGIMFNIALCVPYFRMDLSTQDKVLAAGIDTAERVSGHFRPHLRLVDLMTSPEDISLDAPTYIADLAQSLAKMKGILSLENSKQPWPVLMSIFRQARKRLGVEASSLQICYDACNLANALKKTGFAEFPAALSSTEVAMVHLKQTINGVPQYKVDEGDVSWRDQLAELGGIGYAGPALLEILPHQNVWKNVALSVSYLESNGFPKLGWW